MNILAVYREPFSLAPRVAYLAAGQSLDEMASRMTGLPEDFALRGVICINGHAVPRAAWGMIRPKADKVTEITFHAPPMGGRDSGGKQVLSIVASIALMAVTGGIAANGVTALGIAGKSTAAYALAAGVSFVGSLALAALTAPPVTQSGAKVVNPGNAGLQGNALEVNGAIPRVVGERKIFPPLACEPLTYFDGPDEVVEAAYCLAGPHRLSNIRLGAAPIASMAVDYETREGWPGDAPLTLLTRQSRTESLQSEVRGHVVTDADGTLLDVSRGDLLAVLPQPIVVATREAPEEHQLQIVFAQGLHVNASETIKLRVPLRLRLRRLGTSTWINLPELHFQAASVRQLRATILLSWAAESSAPSAATGEGFVEARNFAPGQSVDPASSSWTTDAYFGTSGDAWMASGNLGTTGVQSVYLDRYTARIALDPAIFPRDRYEIELTRGAVFNAADYDPATYRVNGSVWDLFGYRGSPAKIVRSRSGVGDALYLLRSVSIWNEAPIAKSGLALIAVRARNRSLGQLSVLAGGWVPDWDGTDWRVWSVTDNPAPHLRDIFAGALNANPVPLVAIDNAGLVAWRTAGWSCNAILQGLSVEEAATIVASCGYGRPYTSDVYGIARDRDRSSEAPVQIFTPRNSSGFQWSKAFPRIPDGLRVTYSDVDADYDERQIIVPRRDFVGDPVLLEQATYQGPVTEAAVRARAKYDLDQGLYRSTFYSLTAPAEAIICRKGDLVGVQHDLLTEQQGSGRVVHFTVDGLGRATSLQLDCAVPYWNEPDMLTVANMLTVSDMQYVGAKTALVLRGTSGPSNVLALTGSSAMTDTLTLASPLTAGLAYEGALAVIGHATSTVLRLIVTKIDAYEDLTASLTMVDEAPQIWS